MNLRHFKLSFGMAPFLMLVICVLTLAYIIAHPIKKKNNAVVFWTFAKTHRDAYLASLPEFVKSHQGLNVDFQLVDDSAVVQRLKAAFWADLEVPDMFETPIESAGSFFSGSLKDIGLMDITDKVHQSGLWDRVVQSRFAPYSSRGHIFGLPHDLHPLMIAYRRDIFEREGIDVNTIETWDDFVNIGHRLTKDIDGDGVIDRYMLELMPDSATMLLPLLIQRGGGLFDSDGNLIMDDKNACETLMWYVRQLSGCNKIAGSMGSATVGQMLTQAVEKDYFVCLFMPDWRTKVIETDIPRMAGKFKLMPLPRWSKGGPRTASWGGTMLGIPKNGSTELAWELAMKLYYDSNSLSQRFRQTNIIPPLKEAWEQPAFKELRPFWSGQAIGSLYANIADEIPVFYTSPYWSIAFDKLGEAMVICLSYYAKNQENNFSEFVEETLHDKADYVRAQINRNPYN